MQAAEVIAATRQHYVAGSFKPLAW